MDKIILKALPTINDVTLHLVAEKLNELGVENEEDMELIEDQHMKDVLKPIQVKKFLLNWLKTKKDPAPAIPASQSSLSALNSPIDQPPAIDPSNTTFLQKLDWIKTFEIPWNKMPSELRENLCNKTRPIPTMRLKMIRIICKEIQKVSTHPGRANLRIIAETIVNQYPDSFKDTLCSSTLGNGFASIFNQIESRIENQNRIGQQSRKRRHLNGNGCYDGDDDFVPRDSNSGSQDHQLKKMQEMFSTNNVDSSKLVLCLEATYHLQKADVNNKLTTSELKAKWPGLMTVDGHLIYMKNLMGIEVDGNLRHSFHEQGEQLENVINHKNLKRNDFKLAMGEINNAKDSGYLFEHLGLIVKLMLHFRENPNVLFLLKEETMTYDELAEEHLPEWPCIIILGPTIYKGSRFFLSLDGTIVSPPITSGFLAVTMLFSAFYVFNIEYPKQASVTLEFIQRCLVKINPLHDDKYSKNRGKRLKGDKIHPKVLSFLNLFKNFKSRLTS